MDYAKVALLPLIVMPFLFIRFLMSLRLMVFAVNSVHNETNRQAWDVLILTGIPARKIVWGKWMSIFRQTWPEYLLFSLPMIGFSLVITQTLWSYQIPPNWPFMLQHYVYNSNYNTPINPTIITSFLGCAIIILGSILECALLSAIGTMAGFVWKHRPLMSVITAILYRISLLVLVIILLPLLTEYGQYVSGTCILYQQNVCQSFTHNPYEYKSLLGKNAYRVLDTVMVALVNTNDQGVMVAANIMRPLDDRYVESKWREDNTIKTHINHNDYDNRPYVFRNLIGAIVGFGIVMLLIRYVLRRATHFAVRYHGASGYLEL